MQVPYLEKHEIDQIADEERDRHGEFGQIPVRIDHILEFNYHFKFDIIDGLKANSGVDALLKTGPNLVMAVDYEEYYEAHHWPRLRFSLAHEFGHHLLHVVRSQVFRNVALKSVDDWLNYYDSIPKEQHFSLEWQANQFAGRFLVPLDHLQEQFDHGKKRYRTTPDGFLEPSNILELCPKIATSFGVSPDCIKRRIYNERLNGDQYPD